MPDSEEPPPAAEGTARRLQQGVRDMLLSLLVLLVIIGGLAWVSRGCSFAPGGPSADQGAAPSRDAGELLRSAAGRVGFDVRSPGVPRGWRANSSGVEPVGSGAAATTVVRVGWLTGAGGFLGLAQSDADAVALVAEETGVDETGVTARGSVRVDGREWTVYPGRRDERCWVTELGGVQVLLTGNAGEGDFRTLARAVAAAEPVAR